MNVSRIIGALAITALTSLGAHANGEGDNAPERASAFQSTASVAQVKAEARMPVVISNGSTGFIGVTQSGMTREVVRAEALAAMREGKIARGELGSI